MVAIRKGVKEMYTAPAIEKLGTFRQNTNGLWWGKCQDFFGAKAPICLAPCSWVLCAW